MTRQVFLTVASLLALASQAVAAGSWNFDRGRDGMVPADFYVTAGQWKVQADATAPSPPNVLAQVGRSSTDTFNLILFAAGKYRDVDVSVKLRPVYGQMDQGGGLVWRAQDGRNYYLARYSLLANDVVIYKVQNFGLVQLARAQTSSFQGWHTLRVVMVGDHIECYLDGRKYLDVRDGAFDKAGQVGLWTRGDAVTFFDDFSAAAQ